MVKKIPLSVGISAYNEEKNISFLLKSIIAQKSESYRLKSIYVVNDGSKDRTNLLVRGMARLHPFIKLIDEKKRRGKTRRVNDLFKLNTNQILLYLDADILLKDADFIDKLIRRFNSEDVVLVGANRMPIDSGSLVGELINIWYIFFYETRRDINSGRNIYNFNSCAFAIRKSFSKKLDCPIGDFSLNKYLYFSVLKSGYQFDFAHDAIVLFKSAESLNDYLKQIKRFTNTEEKLANYFGNWIYMEYRIPIVIKIKSFFKILTAHPLLTPLAVGFHFFAKVFPKKKDRLVNKGLWQVAYSSKRLVDQI